MEVNLRPLTLGEILDRTAQLYRTNFLLFAGIFSIYAGVSLMLGLAQLGVAQWTKAAHAGWAIWAVLGVQGLRLLTIFLLLGAAIAAISRTVASLHLGEPVTIRGAYASTLPRLGRYLWLMTITGVLAWFPIILLYGGFLGSAFYFAPTRGHGAAAGAAVAATAQQPQVSGAFLAIAGVFFILLIPAAVYTIWMNIRYSLAVPACVVEDLKARKAIGRSVELSKGSRWRILALGALVVVIKIGVVGLTQSFIFIVAFKSRGQISATMNVISQVIQFFTNTLLGPIGATGLTLFYFDQRVRKEGYDIEWMMQAAGLTQLEGPMQVDGQTQSVDLLQPVMPDLAAGTTASTADAPVAVTATTAAEPHGDEPVETAAAADPPTGSVHE
jgi:hypothetical protein